MLGFYKTFVCTLLISLVISRQIVLVKQNSEFTFKVNIGNLKINLNSVLSLEQKHTWVKSQDCKHCFLMTDQQNTQTQTQNKNQKNSQKINDKNYDCSKSCFDKSEQTYGLKCIETQKNKCKVVKENVEIMIGERKLIGKLIQVKIQTEKNKEKFDQFPVVLVDRIIVDRSEDDTQKALKKGNQVGKIATERSTEVLGQYSIWGSESLFESSIITKNSKNQVIVYDGLKENQLSKQLLDANPIEIEFQQTDTEFTLSQIKIGERTTLNHPQKQTQDKQLPIIPLQRGSISLQTQNLILPKKHFQKLTQHIITTYFSTSANQCEMKESKISCQKEINLDRVQYLQLELILNGISIGFPFKALLKNCKGKSCEVRIQTGGDDENVFGLGTFFLEVFAVEFIKDTENLKLYRLDNQWNQFYSKNEKYHKENFNIFWWMGSSILYTIYYALKIIFYLAIFSLVVNLLYHWRKILEWIGTIFERIKRKRLRESGGELFQNEEDLQSKDTAKLIKRFKNRRNKVFVEDHVEALNDQITTQESN